MKVLSATVGEAPVEGPLTASVSPAIAESPVLSLADKRSEALQDITDELLSESQGILADAMGFPDLDEEHLKRNEPPEEWVLAMGKKAAERKFRLSKYALLPKREAPIGLEQARALAVGIIASKARERSGTKILNVAFVNVPAPPEYPKKVLEMKK